MAAPSSREIVSTLFSADPPMEHWLARVDMLRPRAAAPTGVLDIVRGARGYRVVILDGSGRRDQVAAAVIANQPRPPAIVIADATWKSSSSRVEMTLNRLGVRAIDGPRVSFCVLSHFEEQSFGRTWGPLKARVRFVPWTVTFSESELQRPAGDSGRVFAGGNSLRDYDPLIEAAGSLPAPVDIATNTLSAEQHRRLPANVSARVWPQRAYDELLLNAAVVVVPLQSREDRSSGQTTYVNAMARGKALVITDSPGVRDYIEHGRTGLIVPPGDPAALVASIRRLLDDPAERRQMGRRAREYALSHLTLSHYAQRLLVVADEAVGG